MHFYLTTLRFDLNKLKTLLHGLSTALNAHEFKKWVGQF